MVNILFASNIVLMFLATTGTYLLLLQAFERNVTYSKHRKTLAFTILLSAFAVATGVYAPLFTGIKIKLVLAVNIATLISLFLLLITASKQATVSDGGIKQLSKSHGMLILSIVGFITSLSGLALLFSAIGTS